MEAKRKTTYTKWKILEDQLEGEENPDHFWPTDIGE
jgi:hypothetical protein